MKNFLSKLITALLALLCLDAAAVTRYVDLNNLSPTPPYTNWPTAATNIQDAIDTAVAGDLVLVTNGIYQTGGRTVPTIGELTNRVAVTKALTVKSVNGPDLTVIQGYQVPAFTNGISAVRCVYLVSGSRLIGFTLTNGATKSNAGSADCSGGGLYCDLNSTIVSNCVLIGNSASVWGGGAFRGYLYDCKLLTNTATLGGGVYGGSYLTNCYIAGNTAVPNPTSGANGGGANNSWLVGCIFSGNYSMGSGGGAVSCNLYRCILDGNRSAYDGGGATGGYFENCLVMNNVADARGGGVHTGDLLNCTVVSNTALALSHVDNSARGGGTDSATCKNCIIFYNTSVIGIYSNYYAGNNPNLFTNCCTLPLPQGGLGNITNSPRFVDPFQKDYRLQGYSRSINSGVNVPGSPGVVQKDLSGNPRVSGGVVDMGAYEFQGQVTESLAAWLQKYGLPTSDDTIDLIDSDGDGASNWHEWRAGTIPTNSASVLLMLSATNDGPRNNVYWKSVSGRMYSLDRATNLSDVTPFQTVATNIFGINGSRGFTDSTATNGGPYFYRVGVQ